MSTGAVKETRCGQDLWVLIASLTWNIGTLRRVSRSKLFRSVMGSTYILNNHTYDYTLITNLMHWLLFIHKILCSSTCFEPQVLIFRRIQLYTCSIWYCHSSWWPVGTQLEWEQSVITQAVYRKATTNSRREWQYHMLNVYICILLKMSTWGSKYVEENNILWINNNQCIKFVINI